MKRTFSLFGILIAIAAIAACGRSELYRPGSGGTIDTDTDSDTDSDSDSDSDSDTDTDTDTDTDMLLDANAGFRAVWGTSPPGDVWFAGIDTPTLVWNGTNWIQIADPAGQIYDIVGTVGIDAYAVGWFVETGEEGPSTTYASIEKFNGSTWDMQYVGPADSGMLDIWMDGANNGYAVGTGGTIVRYDGGTWTEIDHGVLWWTEHPLFAVWGYSSDDVYVGGLRDSCYLGLEYPCGGLIHFNGNNWHELTVTGLPWGEEHAPYDVTGTSDGTIHMAANGGFHYGIHTGSFIKEQLGSQNLRGVWAREYDDVWIVGDEGFIGHWDGVAWTFMPQDENTIFYDVWGADTTTGQDGWANDVYAVGGVHDEPTDEWMPIIMHYDGSSWMVIYPMGA